ncbi:Nonribosomal peptide synthetase dtxS1 [Cladobotryum mycophilum]|uniref:Nonribosomal peptide synthetase dtxS1 n=1 Tax=Cladobotryum mycophilum TaxID=491253 RepID=A0ABR0SD97_9HYPO
MDSPAWHQVDSNHQESLSDHGRYWWRRSGYVLAILLKKSSYSYPAQLKHLDFFAQSIAPRLGIVDKLRAEQWKSFMTDDYNPIEFSWDWSTTQKPPVIRYAVEPVGKDAGTPRDQYNQGASEEFLQEMLKVLSPPDMQLKVATRRCVIRISSDDDKGLADVLQRDQITPFDSVSEPGFRVSVYRLDEHDHILSIVLHHIISDGWSNDIIRRELIAFYSAALRDEDPLSQIDPLPIQYRDYSVWQKQQNQVDKHQQQLDYWVSQLETSQPAVFLCDKPRPTTLSGEADKQELLIEGSLYDSLQLFCREREVTPFVVLLAAFRATHYLLTGAADATIGTANANRNRWEVNDLIGFFVNLQCIRIKVGEGTSFEDVVSQIHSTVASSFDNQDVPFERIVSKLHKGRDLSRHPLVQVIFALHSQSEMGEFTLEDVETEMIDIKVTSRYDLEFNVFQQRQGLRGLLAFSTDLYDPKTIKNMLSLFYRVLERGLSEPKTAVTIPPLLTDGDYSTLDEMSVIRVDRAIYPRESSLVDVFHQQVAACPHTVAIKDSFTELTYSQLDEDSDVLAKWLLRRSFAAEKVVAVYAGRTHQTVTALLAILKSNLAYTPLDASTPVGQLESILSSIEDHRLVLVGPDIQLPTTQLENIEFVRIADALAETSLIESSFHEQETTTTSTPSATSLACVVFAPGSASKPDGIMVEHRSIVRLVKQSNIAQQLAIEGCRTAYMANNSLNSSIWEIYSSLLNGGTLVCIDSATASDCTALAETFAREKIQSAIFAACLFKECLLECPTTISLLDTLLIAGERVNSHDIFAARELTRGKIVHAYGQTENSGLSTYYCLPESEACTNGVPIGKAISNSGAYVAHLHQPRLVPLGVVGELVVTGDGLARGYTDHQRNIGRFVEITVDGQRVKAFRTRDYARNRPTDGQLELLGKIDSQVAVRGSRINLGAIEAVLYEHNSVSDAAVVLENQNHHRDDVDARLVGFVTLGNVQPQEEQYDEQLDKDETEQVKLWEDVFNAEMYGDIEGVQMETIGRDFLGWTSAYDGSDIDKAEMNEWLDDTINCILNGSQAGDVLEIGSGSGMVLFNIANGLRSYVGLEQADKAIAFVTKTVKSIPTLEHKVTIHKGTAADIGQLRGVISPNLIIINSVAQYFPSQDYLLQVVKALVEQQGAKTVFFGDIRSQALHKEFQVSKAMHLTRGASNKEEFRRKMAEIERAEKELVVDPAFFTALPSLLPHFVHHVEILPKRVRAINEISCYRYSAVLHIMSQDTEQEQIHEVDEGAWINFVEQKLDRESLLRLLQSSSSSSIVAVGNIPCEKTVFERHVIDSLGNETDETLNQADWPAAIRQKAQNFPSLCALDLVELSQIAGYQVEISWARQRSQRGALDAVFHHYQPAREGSRVMFRFPTDHAGRPLHSLSNQPMRHRLKQKVQDQLQEKLRARLPSYMIPETVTILDKMPTNERGEIDRQALAKESQILFTVRATKRQPTTPMEQQMQQIWSRVLDLEPTTIGLDDSFFQLGGDSIAAMRVVGKARKAGIKLAVADIFRYDTLTSLAQHQEFNTIEAERNIREVTFVDPITRVVLLEEVDSLNIDTTSRDVADILPITNFQEKTVLDGIKSGQFCNYFYLDLGLTLDLKRFKRSCLSTLEKFPILRTSFLSLRGVLWQVVLHELHQPLRILNVRTDFDQSAHEFCLKDMNAFDPTTPPTAFVLLKHKTLGYRLVMRLSHAQYDGVCIPVIFQSLIDGYDGKPVRHAPSFSEFLAYASYRRHDAIAYWRELLKGSLPTPARPGLLLQTSHSTLDSTPRLIQTTAEIDLPRLRSKTTPASLVSAAWALLISQITGADDVIYSYVVAGRNSAMEEVERIVGPCLNVVPIRAKLSSFQSSTELLQSITEQFIAVGEADSLGFKDMIENCTDWSVKLPFDSVIQFQNVDEHPTMRFEGMTSRVEFFENPDPVPPSSPSLGAIFYPRGDRLLVKLRTNTRVMTMETANLLRDGLCGIIRDMTKDLDGSLQSMMDSFKLDI